jgi:hypothetical protein
VDIWEYTDDFGKKYKKGDKFSYQSQFLDDGAIGHEALRTFNLEFNGGLGKQACMNMNFITKL